MAENSKIEWTTHTFNPWRGCTKVSPGCANCYAATMSKRNPATLGVWGDSGTRVVASESQWRLPLKWNREAEKNGVRARVFCGSLMEVMEDWPGAMVNANGNCLHVCNQCGAWRDMESMCHGPLAHYPLTMSNVRHRLFDLIDATQNIDYLLVTKRPENVCRMMPGVWCGSSSCRLRPESGQWNNGPCRCQREPRCRANVWLGTSVENQAAADERTPHLLKVPAAVRFLSCEPLLGPLDLSRWLPAGIANWQCQKCHSFQKHYTDCNHCHAVKEYLCGSHAANKREPVMGGISGWVNRQPIDWVIVGGESGHGARPCNRDWVRSIVRQCRDAGVACFVKQLGAMSMRTVRGGPAVLDGGIGVHSVSHEFRNRFNDPKGGDWSEWPEDLRVREFPKGVTT